MYQISRIPAFSDNYIWALHNDNGKCAIVDPGDSKVVEQFLAENGLTLTEILLTHHHSDHIGGVRQLKSLYPNCKVYGPNSDRFKDLAIGRKDNEKCTISAIDKELTVVELPGHTIDHIGYFDNKHIFVGDTLFSVGCGRLFEGTAEQMHNSLQKIININNDLTIFCAHEYTLANIAFAKTVEPNNKELQKYELRSIQRRNEGKSTVPTTIHEQLNVNPFLRCNSDEIKTSVSNKFDKCVTDEITCFSLLRKWKDQF